MPSLYFAIVLRYVLEVQSPQSGDACLARHPPFDKALPDGGVRVPKSAREGDNLFIHTNNPLYVNILVNLLVKLNNK